MDQPGRAAAWGRRWGLAENPERNWTVAEWACLGLYEPVLKTGNLYAALRMEISPATRWATSTNAWLCGESGKPATMGIPRSPPSRMARSSGTRPRKGISI